MVKNSPISEGKATLWLAEAKEGQSLTVTNITNEEITWQALRFGLEPGSQIRIEKNIPGGPVIVSKNQLEIAIGRKIAEAIKVEPLE
jgi:Fe2+ transport system protein FeoA